MEAVAALAPAIAASQAAAYIPSFATLSTVASVGSAAATGIGLYAEGATAKQNADFEAAQLRKQAEEDKALAGLKSRHASREKKLAQSRVVAVAAGSGGDASDATVTDIMADIESQGQYNALAEMYSGFSSAEKKYASAASVQAQGKAAKTAGLIGGLSKFATGVASAKGLYGGTKPVSRGASNVLPTFNNRYGIY